MKSILVSGLSGFVGQNLKIYLESQGKPQLSSLNLRSNWDRNIKPDIVAIVHLAGKAHDLKNVSLPDEYYSINFDLTKEIYDIFLNSEAKKFIFISSAKASADRVEGALIESNVPDPQTHYGKSKLLAEEYIRNQPLTQGKSFYILRPCMIHGPGNKGNLNLLYKLVTKGIPYPLAAFENKRSFLSVENFCFVIRELLERDDIPSGIYNVADDEALSTNELIKLIASASDRKPKLWEINQVLIRSLAKLGDILKLPLNTERLNKLTENYLVDNSKIKHALGKEFPVRAKDGILKTIQSFQNSKKT
ncbi:MAG: NAD-dependent epimerase/dehydratase family protein [Haliscomenobacter sp.]|nr:NAD-dependent epimerase/dehydratase family protein [Haliscomenobacter sp.]